MQTPGPTGQPAIIYPIAYIGDRTIHHAALIMTTLTGKDTVAMRMIEVKTVGNHRHFHMPNSPLFQVGQTRGLTGLLYGVRSTVEQVHN